MRKTITVMSANREDIGLTCLGFNISVVFNRNNFELIVAGRQT